MKTHNFKVGDSLILKRPLNSEVTELLVGIKEVTVVHSDPHTDDVGDPCDIELKGHTGTWTASQFDLVVDTHIK